MNATSFLKSLLPMLRTTSGRQQAAEEIEGALHYDGVGWRMPPDDRQKLVNARLAILSGKRPEV